LKHPIPAIAEITDLLAVLEKSPGVLRALSADRWAKRRWWSSRARQDCCRASRMDLIFSAGQGEIQK